MILQVSVVTPVKLEEGTVRESNLDSNFNPVKCDKDNSFEDATECFNEEDDEEDDDMKSLTKIFTKTFECPDPGDQKHSKHCKNSVCLKATRSTNKS